MSEEVNKLRWRVGWKPKIVIVAGLVIGLVIGVAIDSIGVGLLIGLVVGGGAWFWGVQEINDKYVDVVEDFERDATNSAKSTLSMDGDEDWYTFTGGLGESSPPLVEPDRRYITSIIAVGDVSAAMNSGAEIDMESLANAGGGSTSELYYDNINNVSSAKDNVNGTPQARLEISSVGGEEFVLREEQNLDAVPKVESQIREEMREARRD